MPYISGPAEPPRFVQRYLEAFEAQPAAPPPEQVRFAVLDSETTGLDPRRDRLITIGAVGVTGGQIVLADCFEALLRIAHNTASVTVHGITRQESEDGFEESDALTLFLGYLGDAVIVGHHIGHDVATLNTAYSRHWGFVLRNRTLDTMDLTLHLEQAGAFPGREGMTNFSLDGLCQLFGVRPHDRHTAGGDAFLTAQVFLRLLDLARRHGRWTLDGLCEPFPAHAG